MSSCFVLFGLLLAAVITPPTCHASSTSAINLEHKQDVIHHSKAILLAANKLQHAYPDVKLYLAIEAAEKALAQFTAYTNAANYQRLLESLENLQKYHLPLDRAVGLAEELDDLILELAESQDQTKAVKIRSLTKQWLVLKRSVFGRINTDGHSWRSTRSERTQMRLLAKQMNSILGQPDNDNTDTEDSSGDSDHSPEPPSTDEEQPELPSWPGGPRPCADNYKSYPGDEVQWAKIARQIARLIQMIQTGIKEDYWFQEDSGFEEEEDDLEKTENELEEDPVASINMTNRPKTITTTKRGSTFAKVIQSMLASVFGFFSFIYVAITYLWKTIGFKRVINTPSSNKTIQGVTEWFENSDPLWTTVVLAIISGITSGSCLFCCLRCFSKDQKEEDQRSNEE